VFIGMDWPNFGILEVSEHHSEYNLKRSGRIHMYKTKIDYKKLSYRDLIATCKINCKNYILLGILVEMQNFGKIWKFSL
jgi:hypothetical protein